MLKIQFGKTLISLDHDHPVDCTKDKVSCINLHILYFLGRHGKDKAKIDSKMRQQPETSWPHWKVLPRTAYRGISLIKSVFMLNNAIGV